jgi:hypothetical protein
MQSASISARVQPRRGFGAGDGKGSGPVLGIRRLASSSRARVKRSNSSGSVSSSTSRSHAHLASPSALRSAWASWSLKGSLHTWRGLRVLSSTGETHLSPIEPRSHLGVKQNPSNLTQATCSWSPVRSRTGVPATHWRQGSSSSHGTCAWAGAASQARCSASFDGDHHGHGKSRSTHVDDPWLRRLLASALRIALSLSLESRRLS